MRINEIDRWRDAVYNPSKGWIDKATKSPVSRLKGIARTWTQVQYNANIGGSRVARAVTPQGNPITKYAEKFAKKSAAKKWDVSGDVIKNYNTMVQRNSKFLQGRGIAGEVARVESLVLATGLRPGSPYKRGAKVAYGATTLQARHIHGGVKNMWLSFAAKKGVSAKIPIFDTGVSAMLLKAKRGKSATDRLFNVTSKQLLEHTRKIAPNPDQQVKDIRTAIGTATAVDVIRQMPFPKSDKEVKAAVKTVGTVAGNILGHTNATMSLKSYINPAVLKPLYSTTATKYLQSKAEVESKYGMKVHGRLHRAKSGKYYHVMPDGTYVLARIGLSH